MNEETHCGFIAIIGRPNVGKSTLLNQLIGQKISITSRKPQTTRHRILGIKTAESVQAIYVDTPGIHKNASHAINQYMNRTAVAAIDGIDLMVFVTDGLRWTPEDDWALEKVKTAVCPIIWVINKVDKIKNKDQLLPFIKEHTNKFNFIEIVPLSAKEGANVPDLEKIIFNFLPKNPHFFPADQITDRSERFLAAELVREKIIRQTGEEVPYAMTVEIEEFKDKGRVLHITAIIWVERQGQKIIIIGKDGQGLKTTGRAARLAMQKLFEKKVFLQLWVKVKEGWSDDERALQSLGYNND